MAITSPPGDMHAAVGCRLRYLSRLNSGANADVDSNANDRFFDLQGNLLSEEGISEKIGR